MKRMAYPFTYLTALAVAAAALLATSAVAKESPSHVSRVEARITELHTKLRITQAQEDLWHNTTQVMRDNAKTLDALIKARPDHSRTTTAVDHLTYYSGISEAHAAGMKKFIPVFEALYVSMSDAQKHNADSIFSHRNPTRSKRH